MLFRLRHISLCWISVTISESINIQFRDVVLSHVKDVVGGHIGNIKRVVISKLEGGVL